MRRAEPLRVLVCRAEDAARRTARHLEAAGYGAVVAPVTRIVGLDAPRPRDRFDALVATSAHAFEADASPQSAGAEAILLPLLHCPLYVVGKATQAAARRRGFTDTRLGASDGAALVDLLRLTLPPPARLLYIAGRDRKPVIEQSLGAAGYAIETWVRYEAVAVETWSQDVVAALRAGTLVAVLHFSGRSADLALGLARRHDVLSAFLALRHACLSEAVAEPLRVAGARDIGVATAPDEANLLPLLSSQGR